MKLKLLIIGLALLASALPSFAGGIMMMGGGVASSGPDYTATVAKIYLRADDNNHAPYRIAVFDASYNKIAETNEDTTVNVAGTRSLTFASNPTLSSSGTYYLAVLAGTNYLSIYFSSATWAQVYVAATYSTFPMTINPGSDTGTNKGNPAIWLENAGGQKIVGDNNTADKTTEGAYQNDRMYYLQTGYTRDTL